MRQHKGVPTMKTFFGFAIADSMFQGNCQVERKVLTASQAKELCAQQVESCLNPSHKATIDAMKGRFGIEVAIPEKAPQVSLEVGDRLIVMGVRGLPRLDATRHEYTEEEIAKATFAFSLWTVTNSSKKNPSFQSRQGR